MASMRSTKHTKYVPIDEREPHTVRAVVLARLSDEGGKDTTIASQVKNCEDFIARMGWPKPTFGPFTEKKSGYRDVRRTALEDVERLIQRREVDVVVVNDWERLARKEERRYAALYHARRYGVEYRFATLGEDGKLDETPMAKMYAAVMQAYGEIERNKIVERTSRGSAYRAAQGLPSGGRGGPPYGFIYADPDEKPHKAWARKDDEADLLLWMYQRIDEDETASIRRVVAELSAQGKLTREGKRWQGHTVLEKLRNPLYCGRGQLRQWKVEWIRKTDERTGETYEVKTLRKRDPNEAGAYLPLAKDAVPVLIPPDLFDRVQRKLDERKYFVGRLGRERSPHHPDDTLLHRGLARCAHCGGVMVRYWRNEKVKSRPGPIPYYRCSKRANDPAHPCRVHAIPAPDVDLLAVELLAFALTDPEQAVKLAELADEQFIRAAEDADRAGVRYDGYRERLNEIERDKTKYLRRLHDYDKVKDADEIEITLSKLAKLADEQARMEREAAAAMPLRERATLRQQMLDTLRRGSLVLGLKQTSDGRWYSTQHDVSTWLAFEALGMPSLGQFNNEARAKAGLDALPTEEAELEARKLATERGFGAMPLDELAARLLASMPREQLREMLRNYNAVVWVSRPHGTRHNPTTVEQRVVLELMRADGMPGLRLCADGTNG